MRFLKKTIFVTAPSDSVSSDGDKLRLKNAIKNFNSLGITVRLGKTVNMINEYNDDEYKLKAKEVEDALLSEDFDTVIAANGGETEINIAKYINFNKLKNSENKIFQGFSDNSILTFLLTTLSGWKSYYAPCFPTFGYKVWDQTIKDNFELLKGNIIEQSSQDFFETNSLKKIRGKELCGYNLDTPTKIVEITGINKFKVKGILLGGCLDVLKMMLNTEYDNLNEFNNKHSRIIWCIENCAMDIIELKETLEIMDKKSWFENVSCFMIGRGKITLSESFLKKQNELLKSMLAKYNVPIITNCDFGHVRPFNTLIMGANTEIIYENNKYTIKYEKVM